MATAQFGSFDNSFVVRFSVNQLQPRDQEDLLSKLLTNFDPKQGHEAYEAYQAAAKVILAVANAKAKETAYE